MANVVHKAREDISKFPMLRSFSSDVQPLPQCCQIFSFCYFVTTFFVRLAKVRKKCIFKLTQMFIIPHATKMLSVYNAHCTVRFGQYSSNKNNFIGV
jgi:hypothetical protein